MGARLTDDQAELRADTIDALTVGPDTGYEWTTEGPGWWAAPELATSDNDRTNADGVTPGRDLLRKHTTTLKVTIFADSVVDLGDKIDAWKAATARLEDGLVAVRASFLGRTRVRYGRFRIPGEVVDASAAKVGYVAVAATQFEALDALTYSDDVKTTATTRALPGAGTIPPFTLPITLPAAASGVVDLVNGGNTPAPWHVRLDGPLTRFALTHIEYDRVLAFTANGGFSIDVGQWLDIDSEGAVLLNGTADRRSYLKTDHDFWRLGPGTNGVRFDADSGAGVATFSWRDAYHS